ncbi:MAG: LuxR C-terminal-related transcriptional regulator [Elainella sp.]
MIRVLILAASAIGRMGLEAILSAEPDLVVGRAEANWSAAGLGAAGPEAADLEAADLVLVAAPLPTSLSAWMQQLGETMAVVWLVDPFSESAGLAWLPRPGGFGLLPQDASAGEIVATIRAASTGLTVLHPDCYALLRDPAAPAPAPVTPLTQRERDILERLAAGMANKTIARDLHISEHTVKFHLGSIFSKPNVTSRTEAVATGIRQGLILL